jgi:parallel beta-helix repeat protein
MHTITRAAVLLVLLAGVLGAAPARAETVACTAITTLPAVITVQGIHCFTGNLATTMTSGNAIEIQTNNVVLDLNGFKLGGLAAGLGTNANGIYALDRQNITIKNGTIRGFYRGIFLQDAGASQGHVVEDLRADQNTFTGIEVQGSGNIIRNNQVVATGGSTVFGANADAYGIEGVGRGTRVLNNDVINTVPRGTGSGRAIDVNTAFGTVVEGNRLGNAALPACCGSSEGVSVSSGLGVLVVNNRITKMIFGISYTGGCSPVSILKKVNPPNRVRLPYHTHRRIDLCEPPQTGANHAPIPRAFIIAA